MGRHRIEIRSFGRFGITDRFVSLDFETSTDDPKTGFPCSLGVALFENGRPIDSKEWLFRPPTNRNGELIRAFDPEALEVGGFDLDVLFRDGKPISAVIASLFEWASRHDARRLEVAAFNAPFDFAFYGVCLHLGYFQDGRDWVRPRPPLLGPWSDTRLLAQDELTEVKSLSLSSVAAALGIEIQGKIHGAADDAIRNGRIHAKLNEWLSRGNQRGNQA